MTRRLSVQAKVSSLALAIALAAGPSPAAAQSLQGTGTIVTNTGGAAGITTGAGTTDVTLNPGQTVIDWTPTDPTPGPIVEFQNSGTTATFSSSSDFAVLNRIDVSDTSRAVFMNGNINSLVDGVSGRGSVFFYSPSGFVIGANAVINVGSLVLTARPITVDPDTGDFIASGFSVGDQVVEFGAQADPFGNIPNPSAAIMTVAGSQIDALAGGSYVAVVAPRVEHHGAISVDGSAALVGAEAATITFRTSGLFDIAVDTGTTDGQGVVADGGSSIGGPVSANASDYHRAYLVAVPKNTALTMLIASGAELGFDIAGAAEVVNNAVVLSAGHDISFGDTVDGPSAGSGADAKISIENASFTSAVYGRANGEITASSVSGTLSFASDASLRGRDLAKLEAGGDGNVLVEGDLRLSGNAAGQGEGETAQAGNVTLQAFAGGQIDVSGDTVLTAVGSGGGSFTPGIKGGEGHGGTILVQATTGGDIRLGNANSFGGLDADARGIGGSFLGPVDGGDGFGGTVNVFASGAGTLTVAGTTYLRADGIAGGPNDCSSCGAVGGIGDGGTVNVQAHSGAGSSLDFNDVLYIWANGEGGQGQVGGLGRGGDILVSAITGGDATIVSDLAIEANGTGGNSFTDGAGGAGIGSQNVRTYADGGTLAIQGDYSANAEGRGGTSEAATGGSGTGGRNQLYAVNGGTLTISGIAGLSATGLGGQGFTGGAGIGGATANNGGVSAGAGSSGTLTVTGAVTLASNGVGGDAFEADGFGLDGGNGTGGLAEAFVGAAGGSLTVGGMTIDANGQGGASFGGRGGDAVGGTARYLGLGGISTLNGDLIVAATGTGGSSQAGTGGDGTGKSARISAVGGDIVITQTASVSTQGFGGSGVTGGNGTGGGDYFDGMIDGAHFFAQNNGDITVGGMAIAMADGFGGDGSSGGDGGDGTGGWASIHAANGDSGPSSITIQAVEAAAFVSANGEGGAGGDGLAGLDGNSGTIGTDGQAGGDGGNGGIGTGGVAAITASAGNGTLNIDFGFVAANGTGGAGGAGGNGGAGGSSDGNPGGNGGAAGGGGTGGGAVGGFAVFGVETGENLLAVGINNGTGNFVAVALNANALGGNGGDGGIGGIAGSGSPGGTAGADGNGGAGGSAEGGTAGLESRGGTVFVTSATLTASATGGDGGAGAAEGIGGDAESDEAYVLVTNRVGDIALRGRLQAGSIDAEVTSTGGNGSTPGASMMEGGSAFFVINGNARIGSVAFNVTADDQIADLATDMIEVINSDVRILGDFAFNTDGVASVYANNGTLNADTFTVSAGNFIHDPDRTVPPPIIGTITATTFDFTTGQDLVIDAHLASTDAVTLVAPGLIDIKNVDSSDGDINLQAGETIAGGTQTAAGSVIANGPGGVTLGDVDAGTFIDIVSDNGNLSLANLTAVTSIDLDAGGDIGFANVSADDLDFSAGGEVTGGDIVVGTRAVGDADGAIVLGDINAGILLTGGAAEDGFAVGFASATSVQVGNVDADESIAFASLGNLTAGALNSGGDVLTMIGGDTEIASITTPGGGRVYHGDVQMFLDAGGVDNFDPAQVFGQAPVQSGGAYNTGAISTGLLQVGAASIATGNINASDSVSLDSATSVTTGTIDTGLLQITAGTNIITSDVFAFDGVDMDAGGSIQTGDIAAGSIDLLAAGKITTGDLTTQIFQLFGGGIGTLLFPGASITLEAGGDILTGDISSIDGVYAQAGGSITTGFIDALTFVEAHAGTDLTTEDIDSGDYIILTADSGAISIGDASATGFFEAVAGTNLTAGAVGASDIDATAGGTVTIDGIWSAGDVQVTSNDIDIAATGAIFAGDLALVSTNGTQTVVGDNVGGGGYQLSDAEYDRLHSNDINVIADVALGATPKMLIGDLTVDGSDGEAIHDYEFVTYDSEGEVPIGSIRVVGSAVFSNMGTEQSVTFTTNRFELDAATGLLSLEQGPGVLGGQLFLDAAHIHVASGDILDRLADDPQYDGYQQDLNDPAEVERPEGVIRAAAIEIEFGDGGPAEMNTLYVQNTGTAELPAGFVVGSQSLLGDGDGPTPPAGSIDVVINGQIVTEGGTLTGIDVRDALVDAQSDLSPFTDNSTINGCLLVGPCVVQPPEPPFPPGFTPTPGLPEEFELIDEGLLPPPLFGNEDFIDDNSDFTEDGATSPIEPPVPLFDTSALGDQGDIDDPVSGSGNPALMETPSVCPTGGDQAADACKEEAQQ